jgi:selenocysteine-specific elongation factor
VTQAAVEAPGLPPVVCTAGHVDHGKTSLVRALTGRDLDVLPEERDRGITIALGFAPLDLPGGARLSLIDVPGHERFVRTMVAGASGVDAVLLCVSAVDGVMPQTREHLVVCDRLGLTQGVVALTFADQVDDDGLALAKDDVAGLLDGTFLAGAPVVAVSSVDGRGFDALRMALGGLKPRPRDAAGPFRMPVDRAFSMTGHGTVATGTAWSGSVSPGATVRLFPGGRALRVRGVQVHGEPVDVARAGQRVALNLAHVDPSELSDGCVLATDDLPDALVIDVHYAHVPGAPALEDGGAVRVLLGTRDVEGRLHFAAERDVISGRATTFAQLRVEAPVPCWPGDRFVLRRASPPATLGGGVVLDPWAPRLREKDRVAVGKDLARLARGDRLVFLERAGEAGLSAADAARRCSTPTGGRVLGDRVLAPSLVGRLEGALLEALEAHHRAEPLSLGAPRPALRQGPLLHLTDAAFDALIDRLVAARLAEAQGPLVRLFGVKVQTTSAQDTRVEALYDDIAEAGLDGVTPQRLAERHPGPETAALVHLLVGAGRVRKVPTLGFVAAGALDALVTLVRSYFTTRDVLTPGDLKDLTGRSRRAAIPLLEWLDAQHVTVRRGDHRVRGNA